MPGRLTIDSPVSHRQRFFAWPISHFLQESILLTRIYENGSYRNCLTSVNDSAISIADAERELIELLVPEFAEDQETPPHEVGLMAVGRAQYLANKSSDVATKLAEGLQQLKELIEGQSTEVTQVLFAVQNSWDYQIETIIQDLNELRRANAPDSRA